MENLTAIEQHWSEQFRRMIASIAGVKLFDNMWVEETPSIGTVLLPWNAISIEYPFLEENEENITVAIRAFSFGDHNAGITILKDNFSTCCAESQYTTEMYVPAIMIAKDSLARAAKKGLSALNEFNLSHTCPFIIQVMIDDGGVEFLIEIDQF